MPKNRKESLLYTMMMCAFMVFWMSVYNVALYQGLNSEALQAAWIGFPLAYLIGCMCDWLLVASLAKRFAFKMVSPNSKPIYRMVAISSCMVIGMVFCMSLYGAIEQGGIGLHTIGMWGNNIWKNTIVALPLQLCIAGPFIRRVFAIMVEE